MNNDFEWLSVVFIMGLHVNWNDENGPPILFYFYNYTSKLKKLS